MKKINTSGIAMIMNGHYLANMAKGGADIDLRSAWFTHFDAVKVCYNTTGMKLPCAVCYEAAGYESPNYPCGQRRCWCACY